LQKLSQSAVTEATWHSKHIWAYYQLTSTFYGHYILDDDGVVLVCNT
jgi:hypothetical protein